MIIEVDKKNIFISTSSVDMDKKKSTIYITKYIKKYFINIGYAVFEEVNTEVPIINIKNTTGKLA